MKAFTYIFSILLISLIYSCKDSPSVPEETVEVDLTESEFDISDWTESTHGKSADPDFSTVFPDNKVNRFDIVISENNWDAMLTDMEQNYGSFGSSGGRPVMGASSSGPVYVPSSVFFNGKEWYKVGVRFKGNSSLQSSWGQGIWKLPLRINFDKFEDEYPQIDNQRFYGFKELSLSSNYDDKSLIRERVVPAVFRDFGVPAAHTAFYRIYIDFGNGPVYFGLYTAVEVVDDTVLEEQFDSDEGNCYKPEGASASFASNTFSSADFEKKTNEDSDWSDIQQLFSVLNSSDRTSSPSQWRNSLEDIFDTDIFLRWLAVNITVQNWDTYGRMTHNYYLYNNPENNKLTWIPWDNNEALQYGKQGGALSVSCSEVGSSWPLIRYILDDEIYKAKYDTYLNQVINGPFEPTKMIEKYQQYHDLISEYVIGADGEQVGHTFLTSDGDFESALSQLISHVNSRYSMVQNYLD